MYSTLFAMLGCGTTSWPNVWTRWMLRTTSKLFSTPPLSTSCLIRQSRWRAQGAVSTQELVTA